MKYLAYFSLILILTSCGSIPSLSNNTPTPDICGPEAMLEYYDSIHNVGRRFDDALELAKNTSRMNLPPVISDMQAIRRDAEDLKVPNCAETAREKLVNYMDSTIDAFLAFMADEPDATITRLFGYASDYFDQYNSELEKMLVTPTPGG